jgi:hypothetical protein
MAKTHRILRTVGFISVGVVVVGALGIGALDVAIRSFINR